MPTLAETAIRLLTTQKVTEKKIRRRRERRRRREVFKEQRAQLFQVFFVREISFRRKGKEEDGTSVTSLTDIEEEDDMLVPKTAEVTVEDQSQPFIGKIQETPAMVRVPERHERYEIY